MATLEKTVMTDQRHPLLPRSTGGGPTAQPTMVVCREVKAVRNYSNVLVLGHKLPFSLLYFPLFHSGETDRIRRLEETIREMTKELNNVQTTMQGINQRL